MERPWGWSRWETSPRASLRSEGPKGRHRNPELDLPARHARGRGYRARRGTPSGAQDSGLELVGFHAEGLAAVRRWFIPPDPGCPPGPEIVYVTEEGLFRWSGGEPLRIGAGTSQQPGDPAYSSCGPGCSSGMLSPAKRCSGAGYGHRGERLRPVVINVRGPRHSTPGHVLRSSQVCGGSSPSRR
jgi:hypothetical protein